MVYSSGNESSHSDTPQARRKHTGNLSIQQACQLVALDETHYLMLNARLLYWLRDRLDDNQLILGRGPFTHTEEGLALPDSDSYRLGVSRNHAALIPLATGVGIKDLGSTNGSYVNGQSLSPKLMVVVSDNDEIQLGNFKLMVRFSS